MSKRVQCKLKYDEDEKAAAHVFQDFMKTFHSNTHHANKVFIKSATLHAKSDTEANIERGRIYKPIPKIPQCSAVAAKKALECAKLVRDDVCTKSSKGEKPKSNLDLLKEELKQRHSERILRKNAVHVPEVTKATSSASTDVDRTNPVFRKDKALDEFDFPCRTTNLFINNLRPTMTESELMVLFGEYGPLASVKIMWPRNTNASISSENCGFVAFMSRRDSERAIEHMTNNSDMRISWGKPVELPSFPIYIPPKYQSIMPSSGVATGLPFNAQPLKSKYIKHQLNDMQDVLYNSRVILTVPFDKKLISTIHRMVEFVVREGPLFEAMIMNREIKNPLFEFLFENKSPAHAYYRWKLYSVAHGESTTSWSKKEFRMFKGGAVWVPPSSPNFCQGMPDYLFENSGIAAMSDLSFAQESRLVQFIQGVRMTKQSIRDVTVYCLNHSKASKPIVDIVCTSLLNPNTNPTYKIARLYLLSDILHNVWRGKESHHFLTAFDKYLDDVFGSVNVTYRSLELSHDRAQFKNRVRRVLRTWNKWALFTADRIVKWRQQFEDNEEDYEREGLDGPMDGQRLRAFSKMNEMDDFDRAEMGMNDIVEMENLKSFVREANEVPERAHFVTSRWEAVDPTEIEANAMSTKRLFALENNRLEEERNDPDRKSLSHKKNKFESSTKTSKCVSESVRAKLREIEMQVLQFQDDLESGKIKPKRSRKLDEEILNYRRKLMKRLAVNSKGDILIT